MLQTFKETALNKSPGPDRFSTEFFIKAWHIVGTEVSQAVLLFFTTLKMPRIVNSTGIALIPKQDHPDMITQFRPISCCNVLYNCVAKMLAKWLKSVLPTLISPSQSAFVFQQLIGGDNIMLAESLCRNYHLNSRPQRCAIKLDLHKAFDTLNWNFLLGFPHFSEISFKNVCLQPWCL